MNSYKLVHENKIFPFSHQQWSTQTYAPFTLSGNGRSYHVIQISIPQTKMDI